MYIKYFVLTHEIIFSRREVNHPRDRLEASDKDGKVLLRVGLGTVDYKCTSDWGIQSALAVFVHGYLKTSKSYLSWITFSQTNYVCQILNFALFYKRITWVFTGRLYTYNIHKVVFIGAGWSARRVEGAPEIYTVVQIDIYLAVWLAESEKIKKEI